MGDLPTQRINPPRRPFLATGVDYTGAIELKASRYRGHTIYKSYITIFICLETKAIHLEAVTGMTTEHFLWALQRFIGRRRLCNDLYSACGTNFMGANAILTTNHQRCKEDVEREIVPKLAEQSINWHFNPPHSPNFGGLWEANVKSIKYHLKRIVGGTKLTYEQLSTVLVRIEACLNSRPLCPLTSDPDDLFVLTPGYFLIESKPISAQYIKLQRLVQLFWSKWKTDCLSHLQARLKWKHEEPNLSVNELLLVKDERLPPNQWMLGRVVELHPGSDKL
ncbi:PREDICTED: uncharacterized protein LOC108355303, partial [Rhagoletis zephyria]|uniref:uncharacterized protein LOC108355303 n=1 Tax=Rhagoletis zephyria TaxID=28612 RepID=UPI0008112ABB